MNFTNKSELTESLVNEYFMRNERKKQDEAWIKKNRSTVIKSLNDAGKSVEDVGDIRIKVTIPNTSKFDEELVLKYAREKGFLTEITKLSLDEPKLVELIEKGLVNLEELTERAWIESTGSPRITIQKIK